MTALLGLPMSMQDMGTAALIRESGKAVSIAWVVMPPMEWPDMPTPTVVSMWPANGSPPLFRASVRVMASELSRGSSPLYVSPMPTLGTLGAGTMKPAAASGRITAREPCGVPPRPCWYAQTGKTPAATGALLTGLPPGLPVAG